MATSQPGLNWDPRLGTFVKVQDPLVRQPKPRRQEQSSPPKPAYNTALAIKVDFKHRNDWDEGAVAAVIAFTQAKYKNGEVDSALIRPTPKYVRSAV